MEFIARVLRGIFTDLSEWIWQALLHPTRFPFMTLRPQTLATDTTATAAEDAWKCSESRMDAVSVQICKFNRVPKQFGNPAESRSHIHSEKCWI